MRHNLLIVLIGLGAVSAIAYGGEKLQRPNAASWKTLVNENGYEFKYPDCERIDTANPSEVGMPVWKARHVVVIETEKCMRPLLYPPNENGIGFHSLREKQLSKDGVQKEIDRMEINSKNAIERKDWLSFKKIKNGPDVGYSYVEREKDVGYTWIRWKTTVFCPAQTVVITGPAIREPDQSTLDKLKSGENALPEPERTILESVRCVQPKK